MSRSIRLDQIIMMGGQTFLSASIANIARWQRSIILNLVRYIGSMRFSTAREASPSSIGINTCGTVSIRRIGERKKRKHSSLDFVLRKDKNPQWATPTETFFPEFPPSFESGLGTWQP